MLFAFTTIAIGVLAYQSRELQKEVWRLRSEQRGLNRTLQPPMRESAETEPDGAAAVGSEVDSHRRSRPRT